jgi:hypothetical protein
MLQELFVIYRELESRDRNSRLGSGHGEAMNMINPYETAGKYDLPLSDIGSDLIQQFHRHWLRLCSDGRLPSRDLIDPANFKRLMPNVILADIERNPFRVRYRLCGTRVTELCGNLTGRYLDQIEGDLWSTATWIQQYQTVATEARPIFAQDWMLGTSGARHLFQTGIWPLATDGRTVDRCIAVEDYSSIRRADLHSAMVAHLRQD